MTNTGLTLQRVCMPLAYLACILHGATTSSFFARQQKLDLALWRQLEQRMDQSRRGQLSGGNEGCEQLLECEDGVHLQAAVGELVIHCKPHSIQV